MPVFPSLRALMTQTRPPSTVRQRPSHRRTGRRVAFDWLERRDMPAVGFPAIDLATQFSINNSGGIPPDTMGAVGPNHFVESINNSIAIYSKTTGTRLQYVIPDTFFASMSPASGTYDPRILYDRPSGRWFMTTMEFGTNQLDNDVLLAVSKTSDPTYAVSPTDAWNFYRIDLSVANAFTDYSSLGVDSNGVYFGATYFPASGSFTKIVATPKAPLLAASPSLGALTISGNITDMFGTPQPATAIDATAPTAPMYFVASSTSVFANLTYRTVTWSGSTPTIAGTTSTLTTPGYGSVRNAPALGSTTLINAGDDRVQQAVSRNGQIWVARNVGVTASGGSGTSTRTAAEWLNLNGSTTTPTLNQSGRVFDSAASNQFYYYYPSLTVTGQGIVRMAFSGSNALSRVNAYSTFRLPTDAAGTMSAPVAFVTGQAAYTRNDSGGRNRWGDYSYTSLDPNDDMTAWTIQEYAAASVVLPIGTVNSNWGTYVQSFDAPAPTLSNPAATATQGTNGNVLNLTGTNFYDPGAGFANRLAVSVSGAGVTVTNVTYNSPTSVSIAYNVAGGAAIGARNITLTNPDGQATTATNALTIQAAAATVIGVTSTVPDGTYGAGSVIPITVTFSGPVTVTGNPQLVLNSSGVASYSSGSTTSTLTFTYTVTAGQTAADLNYVSTGSLTLNGGTIVGAGSLAADLTLPPTNSANSLGFQKNIVIDAVAPTILGVTSPTPDGTYGTGSVIVITVGFSKTVVVTGTPTLALNSGGTASYTSGTGSPTLTFTYTVGAGQSSADLDAASAAALTGTIQDTVANNPNAAVLTVPVAPAGGSLGTNKNLVIDAIAPTVTEYRVLFGSKSYNIIGTSRVRLPWQITGIQVVFSEPIAAGSQNSLTGLSTTSFVGLNTNTLTWTILPSFQGSFTTLLSGVGGTALKDAAGNALGNGAGYGQAFKVLEGDFDDNGVVDSRDMVSIQAAIAQAYNIFADIDGNGVVDANDVKAARKRVGLSQN